MKQLIFECKVSQSGHTLPNLNMNDKLELFIIASIGTAFGNDKEKGLRNGLEGLIGEKLPPPEDNPVIPEVKIKQLFRSLLPPDCKLLFEHNLEWDHFFQTFFHKYMHKDQLLLNPLVNVFAPQFNF